MSIFGNSFDKFDDIQNYLPKYLSRQGTINLFRDLIDFTESQKCKNFYSEKEFSYILQGDGIGSLLMINFPSSEVQQQFGMILSNTCDIDREHSRKLPPRLNYCPIIKLSKLIRILKSNNPDEEDKVDEYVSDIKKQKITQFFYLPKNGKIEEESIALLDRINNCSLEHYPLSDLLAQRHFSLSDFGFYFFIFKLSIHLMRIREEVQRSAV